VGAALTESSTRSYGVKEQFLPADETDQHVERLRLNGFTLVDGGYDAQEQGLFAELFDRVLAIQTERHGGYEALRRIDEHNTIRAPLTLDPRFIHLAQNTNVLAIAERIFRGSPESGAFILNQQNGILNPPRGEAYNQGAWHRDLPYQHFVSTRPLAINALYCIEPFTLENGATLVVRGTHREESFPSNELLQELAEPVTAPAGSFLLLDCMIYHSGGVNLSQRPRRAVNHVYTIPLIRQQIDLPTAMPENLTLSAATRKLLGYGFEAIRTPADYYRQREAKFGVRRGDEG
jgi:ectoine hydroxylase-related dioxygenase (phytanoyl-CoA dioxygenase family)